METKSLPCSNVSHHSLCRDWPLDLLYSAYELQHISHVSTPSDILFKHPLITGTPVNHWRQWTPCTHLYPFKTYVSLGCPDASMARCSCHHDLNSIPGNTGRKRKPTTRNYPLASTCAHPHASLVGILSAAIVHGSRTPSYPCEVRPTAISAYMIHLYSYNCPIYCERPLDF